MVKTIYLDNSATAPVFPEVVKAMIPYFIKTYGNPSSPHQMGEDARKSIEDARRFLALELGCKAYELIFTSGGTESNVLALRGLAELPEHEKKKKIVISAIEHSSLVDICEVLEKKGYQIVTVGVDHEGILNWEELEKEITYDALLVSIIHGNNEIGTLQDVRRIGALCKKRGVLFHTDAVQSFGKEMVKVHDCQIDLLSASAHKLGGSKGVGLLYVRSGVVLSSIICGGQERGLRGGTEHVAGIVGFAKALEVMNKSKNKLKPLQEQFIQGIEKLGGVLTGSREHRLQDHVSVTFPGVDAELLVLSLSQKGVMCSTKSACLNKDGKESRVLQALGLSKKEIRGAVRFGLHPRITKADITHALNIMKKSLQKVKRVSYR